MSEVQQLNSCVPEAESIDGSAADGVRRRARRRGAVHPRGRDLRRLPVGALRRDPRARGRARHPAVHPDHAAGRGHRGRAGAPAARARAARPGRRRPRRRRASQPRAERHPADRRRAVPRRGRRAPRCSRGSIAATPRSTSSSSRSARTSSSPPCGPESWTSPSWPPRSTSTHVRRIELGTATEIVLLCPPGHPLAGAARTGWSDARGPRLHRLPAQLGRSARSTTRCARPAA